MAIVDTQRKQILLLPYKTGTTSIRQIFIDSGRSADIRKGRKGNHPNIDKLFEFNTDLGDVSQYEVHAFYRDPVDRLISWTAYNYNKFPFIQKKDTIHEYLANYGIAAYQVRWLKHDTVNINLLDYRKFEVELREVLVKFGVPQNVTIPVLNEGGENKRPLTSLTADEIQRIKELYVDDYAFFASKGITFSV